LLRMKKTTCFKSIITSFAYSHKYRGNSKDFNVCKKSSLLYFIENLSEIIGIYFKIASLFSEKTLNLCKAPVN
jgi:hypothetical protein